MIIRRETERAIQLSTAAQGSSNRRELGIRECYFPLSQLRWAVGNMPDGKEVFAEV